MTINSGLMTSIANIASSNYEASGQSMLAIASGDISTAATSTSSTQTQLSISVLDMALETQKGINLDVLA